MARQDSMLAAIGGFILGPAVVGIAAGFALPQARSARSLSFGIAAAHAAGLAGAWWAADKYPQWHSLLRGAMWGEGVATVFAASEAAQLISPQSSTSSVALARPSDQGVAALTRRVLQGGWLAGS